MGIFFGSKTTVAIDTKWGTGGNAASWTVESLTDLSFSGGSVPADVDITSFGTTGARSYRPAATYDGGTVSMTMLEGEIETYPVTTSPVLATESIRDLFEGMRSNEERGTFTITFKDIDDATDVITFKAFVTSISTDPEIDGLVPIAVEFKICDDA